MRSSWTGGETLDSGQSVEGLALAVQRREEGAFERLVKAFEKPLFNYANKLLQHVQDSQEVVQDTFLRAHRALTQQYSGDRCRDLALRPWLYRIARNLCHNKRRGKRHSVEQALGDDEIETRWDAGEEVAIICRVEQKQELERLSRAIARLPRESRDLVFLRFIEEMSYAEISTILALPVGTLKSRLCRARRELIGRLQKQHQGACHQGARHRGARQAAKAPSGQSALEAAPC